MPENTFPLAVPEPSGKVRFAVNTGTCGIARGGEGVLQALRRSAEGRFDVTEAGCDGACYQAPAVTVLIPDLEPRRFAHVTAEHPDAFIADIAAGGHEPSDAPFFARQTRMLLGDIGIVDPTEISSALQHGAYRGLWRAVSTLTPRQVLDEIAGAGLQEVRTAIAAAGPVPDNVHSVPTARRIVFSMADEGTNVLIDRHLLEGHPHLLLEGLMLAGYATGATHAVVQIDPAEDQSRDRVARAISQAHEHGIFGANVLGVDWGFSVELQTIGDRLTPKEDATALAEFDAEALCRLPIVLRDGLEAYRAGIESGSTGTELVWLSGAVQGPGLVEIETELSEHTPIPDIGGGPPGF